MKIKLLIALAFIILGSLFFYNSRGVKEPGDDVAVTEVPLEIQNVLGTQTAKPEISIRVPIFIYHYVEYVQDKNDTTRQKLNIPPYVLIAQIETLKNAEYTFINTSDLAEALSGKTKLPQKSAMLTFDDGYMDFYTDVLPILKRENVKAVEYVIPDFLNRPNFMFTYQLKEIAKSPFVEIGAHTMDHVWLKGMNKKAAQYEIEESRKQLRDLTGLPIDSFAYPYGAFDQQAVDLAKSAGFTNAVSTVPGITQTSDAKYFLYRLRPGYRTGQELLDYLKSDKFKPW